VHAAFPPTAIAAAGLAPFGWLATKLFNRFNKKGRKGPDT
jgi:hypothetical protein